MLGYLVTNTNKCTGYSKLNKIAGIIWYQGESEALTSSTTFAIDLATLRTNIISGITGFTATTPEVVTLINNKYDIDNTISSVSVNKYINDTLTSFAQSNGYGVVKTED